MQEADDLISMLFHVIGFVKKYHDKVPRSVLKFYAYLNNNVKSGEFKEDKFRRLYKSCKVALLELVKDKKLIFDNETKEREWFAKMDDLEEKIKSEYGTLLNEKDFLRRIKMIYKGLGLASFAEYSGVHDTLIGFGEVYNSRSVPLQLAGTIALSKHFLINRFLADGKKINARELTKKKVLKGIKILDLGCGYKPTYARCARAMGAEVYTIDIIPSEEFDVYEEENFSKEERQSEIKNHLTLNLEDERVIEKIEKSFGKDFDIITESHLQTITAHWKNKFEFISFQEGEYVALRLLNSHGVYLNVTPDDMLLEYYGYIRIKKDNQYSDRILIKDIY